MRSTWNIRDKVCFSFPASGDMRVKLNLNFSARNVCAMRLKFEVMFLSSFPLKQPVNDTHHFLSILISPLTFLSLHAKKIGNKHNFPIPSKPIYFGIIYIGGLTLFFEVCQALKTCIIVGDDKSCWRFRVRRSEMPVEFTRMLTLRKEIILHDFSAPIPDFSSLFSNP